MRADGRGQHGAAVVRLALHVDIARLEPALDERGSGLHPVQGSGVVGDQALGESAFIHGAGG